MKKLLTILLLLITTPVWAEEEKPLTLTDIFGDYYSSPNSNELEFHITKEKSGKIKIDDIYHKYIFICSIDMETDEDFYLTCDKLNEKWDWFKHPYIVISKFKPSYKPKGYIYMFYHLLGKENYEKYHCDEDRKNGKYNSRDCTQFDNAGYKREK